jgi:hypothetical protein
MGITELPYPKYQRGKLPVREYVLPEDLYVEQWVIPKGTLVRLFTGPNFGYCYTPDLGNTRRLFRY